MIKRVSTMAKEKDIDQDDLIAIVDRIRHIPVSRLADIIKKNEVLQTLSEHSILSIQNEMKRLWQHCNRTIDLRYKVSDLEVERVDLNGITRFLDKSSLNVLRDELERYGGQYTIGAYEHVKRYFESNKQSLIVDKLITEQDIKSLSYGKLYERKEERMNLAITATAYILDATRLPDDFVPSRKLLTKPIKIVTSNISKTALKIKAHTYIPEQSFVIITFDYLERELIFEQGLIVYQVIHAGFNTDQEKYEITLRLHETPSNEEFRNYTKNLIFSHKHKYKVDLDAIVEACIVKGYEQYFVSSTENFSLFIDNKHKVSHIFGNEMGLSASRAFQIDNKNFSQALINKHDLINRLKTQSSVFLFVVRVKQSENQKVAFLSTIVDQSDESFAMIQRFCDTSGSMLFKVNASPVDVLTALRTSIVPIDAQKEYGTERTYRTSTQAQDIIKRTKYILIFSRVMEDMLPHVHWSDQTYNLNPIHIIKNDEKNVQGNLPSVCAEVDDFRVEDRFILNSNVTVIHGNKQVAGVTEDISTLGLKIKLQGNLSVAVGKVVKIRFDDFRERTTLYSLNSCTYVIIGNKGQELRLCNKDLGQHDARNFFTEYIRKKLDTLTPIGHENEVYGLSRLFRNVTSNCAPNAQLFTHSVKNKLAISAVAATAEPFYISDQDGDLEADLKSWFLQEDIAANIKVWLSEQREQQTPLRALLILSITNQRTPQSVAKATILNTNALDKEKLQTAITQLSADDKPLKIFELKISTTASEFTRYYNDEMNYIRRFAPHKHKTLRHELSHINSIFDVIDVSSMFSQFLQGQSQPSASSEAQQ